MVSGIFDCFSVRIDFETVEEDIAKLMLIDLPHESLDEAPKIRLGRLPSPYVTT